MTEQLSVRSPEGPLGCFPREVMTHQLAVCEDKLRSICLRQWEKNKIKSEDSLWMLATGWWLLRICMLGPEILESRVE